MEKINKNIKKFNKSVENVAGLMNDPLTTTDFFTKKRRQIEESIKTGKTTFDKLRKELELIASKPELTSIITEVEKMITENDNEKLNLLIEEFKKIISNSSMENIDALLKEIQTIEETLKRDEARFNQSRETVDQIMNGHRAGSVVESKNQHEKFKGNFDKTIILAILILSVYEQIESVQSNKLIFKKLPDSGSFIKPPFQSPQPDYSFIPPTA